MKKFISLLVCLSMLICMFTFAPTASAAEMYDANGETVDGSSPFSEDSNVRINYSLSCINGWLDGTNGQDRAYASMRCSQSISCFASIDLTATYISNGSYTDESDYDTTSTLGSMAFTVSIYPSTDLLAYADALFYAEHTTKGEAEGSLSASCPTAVK